MKRIFLGKDGLRAGWSALLFIALLAAFGFGIFFALHFIRTRPAHQAAIAPLQDLVQECALLVGVFLATLVMARIEKRSVFSYGFQDAHKLARLLSGMVFGIVAISGLVGILWVTGALAFDGRVLQGVLAWKYGALWLAAFLVVGLFEESLLRGYLQFTLARGLTFWGAAALLSVAFGLLHLNNPGESVVGILGAIGAGLVFCLGLRLTGSLWWVVGVHAGFDFAESYVYGTADSGVVIEGHLFATHPVGNALWSGGTAGPEASIYILLVLLLLAAGIWLRWGRRAIVGA